MKPVFFNNKNQHQLYGVHHSHRSNKSASRAIVFCPPLGQEYIRTHWACKLLAKQLARGGAHVLRFDWSGHGNSAGNIDETLSLQQWIDNVGQAVDWIREESKADSVMLIGQRFGATLAALAAEQRQDVYSLVAWEPVVDGTSYLQGLRSMHARMVDLWMSKTSTRNDDEFEEILGFQYSRELLNEIEQTKLDLGGLYLPQLIVDLKSSNQTYSHIEPSLQRTILTDDEMAWEQLLTLETACLRPETTRTVVKTVAEMFERLERAAASLGEQSQQAVETV